jgi:uncharacterized protein YdeI (YjbR/CyaY-like superfamily)
MTTKVLKHDSYPKLNFKNPTEFEHFLNTNFDKIPGVWVKIAKKNSGVVSITYDEALEVALCYGWIDGQGAGFDETYSLIKFTPRGPKSLWSKRNVGIAEELIKQKKMHPAGLVQINAAKADGRWERAYAGSSEAVIPDDFIKELKKDPGAYKFYLTLNKANLYAIYFRLQTAASPKVRQARTQVILESLRNGKAFH